MPITVSGTAITFNDSTTQSTAGITTAVTSAVAGNGIGVSGSTGAVTFSAACPGFNTVGSYCFATINAGPRGTPAAGGTYAAGNVQAFTYGNGTTQSAEQNNLSGTWRWMAAGNLPGCGGTYASLQGNACRVS